MSGTARTVTEIPLSASPQTFGISLNSILYNVRVVWNPPSQAWIMDVSDVNGVPILLGVPLVTGADLLEQYAYLGIGGSLYVQSDGVQDAVPTFTNLGTTGHLYFVTPQDPPPT